MKTPEYPSKRRIERRELITLFAAMPPGTEISGEEVLRRTGLDVTNAGDRSLTYNVREHCRDVLGFVVEFRGGSFVRLDDQGVIKGALPKRRERILRQSRRGVAESMAIADWAALSAADQLRVLSHQSLMGVLAAVSHRAAPQAIEIMLTREKRAEALSFEKVIAAVKTIRQ